MTAAHSLPDLSRTEDFLAWVWRQERKFEQINGRLVMMAGGSRNHSVIAANTIRALGNRLLGRPCREYTSDFLVVVAEQNRYFPDLSVACDERRDFTDRPVMVVEVLSPGTHRDDMGEKLDSYLRTPSMLYVLYLWQDQPRARLWRPSEDGGASPGTFFGLDSILELPALDLTLPLAELYRDVDFVLSEVG